MPVGVQQLRQPYAILETEHGQQSKVHGPTVWKSPPLSVQQFPVQAAISYLDTLIANINSRLPGDEVELVVSASVFNPALILEDEPFLRAFGNSKL